MGGSQSSNNKEVVINWDTADFSKIPGVLDDKEVGRMLIKMALEAEENEKQPWMGSLTSIVSQTMPDRFKKAFEGTKPENAAPAPEKKPYTFWEKVGAMPVAKDRLRSRQYYYPYTDFRDWTYDEASPEEQELRARWLSRMFEVSWHWPLIYFTTSFTCCLPLPPVYRTPAVVCCALTSVFLEGMRVYINAGHEREMLDDFIVAKEFWYVKNVEALELGLVAKTKMTEEEKERQYLEKQHKDAENLNKLAMIAKDLPPGTSTQNGRFTGFSAIPSGGAQIQHSNNPYAGGVGSSMMPDPVQGLLASAPGVPKSMTAGGGNGAGSLGGGFGGGGSSAAFGGGPGGAGGALGNLF